MSDDAENDGADEMEDDGPILLPPGATCATCAYSFTVSVPGTSVIQGAQGVPTVKRFCRRHPPTSIVLYAQQGGTITGQPPPVDDGYVCFDFDPATPTLFG